MPTGNSKSASALKVFVITRTHYHPPRPRGELKPYPYIPLSDFESLSTPANAKPDPIKTCSSTGRPGRTRKSCCTAATFSNVFGPSTRYHTNIKQAVCRILLCDDQKSASSGIRSYRRSTNRRGATEPTRVDQQPLDDIRGPSSTTECRGPIARHNVHEVVVS